MTSCPSESEIKDFLERHESRSSDGELMAHLEDCPRCQKLIGKQNTEFLGAASSSEMPPTVIVPILHYTQGGASLSPEIRARLDLIPKALHEPKAAPAVEETPLPKRIDHYELVRRVGKGGMSRVYRVRDVGTGEEFALKLLSADLLTQPDAVNRARREIKALGKLRHENIVEFHGDGQFHGRPYLVTELLVGQDLAVIATAAGCLSVPRACQLMIQAARGLAFAHANHVVHRDIKPGNLFVTLNGTLKILDFGVAQFRESTDSSSQLTPSGYMMGTAQFMAPEQVESLRQADLRSDIYSLGCVLAQLLTGELVFGNLSYFETLLAHRSTPAPSLRLTKPNLPEAIDQLVLRMLEKDPAARPQTMDEVISLLERFTDASLLDDSTDEAEGETVEALPTSANVPQESTHSESPKSQPIPTRLKLQLALIVGACVLAALAFAQAWW